VLVADSGSSIVINAGSGWRVKGFDELSDGYRNDPCGWLLGPMTRGSATVIGNNVDAVGAYFYPSSVSTLTRAPAWEITDRVVSLQELFGASGSQLVEETAAANTIAQRIKLLECALLRIFTDTKTASVDRIDAICMTIAESTGGHTVEHITRSQGISRQYLARLFREHIGISPKLYVRLSRFRRAISLVAIGNRDSADIAAQLGYADQSHMIAEFREFTGLTPHTFSKLPRFHPFAM
jgi:AraC-like DNA-binding protein